MVLLIVDMDSGVAATLLPFLRKRHEVLTCEDGESALRLLSERGIDVAWIDPQGSKRLGLDFIRKGREASPGTCFLVVASTVESGREARAKGAYDYFLSPPSLDEVDHRLSQIEDLRAWRHDGALLRGDFVGEAELVGESPAMARAREFVRRVAGTSSPLLLLGPYGSGKEIVARIVHETGPRSHRPFAALSCEGPTEAALEAELFGTESRAGKLELASGGTLYLREVGALGPALQDKVIRVLKDKEFQRAGSSRWLRSDARLLAASCLPLREMVRQGEFREDLFFRLNVVSLELSSLANRPSDLPALVDYYWTRACARAGKVLTLSPETRACLENYGYPGNLRELVNALERLALLAPAESVVDKEMLPQELLLDRTREAGSPVPREGDLNSTLEALELKILQETLRSHNFNQVKAAAALGITRGALQYKMKKYSLSDEDKKAA